MSGFGLTIVRMLADQLSGNLSITNDNGTTFTIVFEKLDTPTQIPG
ncbi:hypothetical protein L21SP2_3332 [Salinispira pacifica]|uniref:Histidine kinase/HSP90-like ATPase domain-containing protein n=1 Tax=Salinispira pacifica TaxID=1307761 RepID=V5WM24_9SPIO|nr:hypothetical protein L21SP2_3332 [Salinispira pacifica]